MSEIIDLKSRQPVSPAPDRRDALLEMLSSFMERVEKGELTKIVVFGYDQLEDTFSFQCEGVTNASIVFGCERLKAIVMGIYDVEE